MHYGHSATRHDWCMSIGILTSGGDCPGLNAVIRGAVLKGIQIYDKEFVGFKDGWRGVVEGDIMRLERKDIQGIGKQGRRRHWADQSRGADVGEAIETLILPPLNLQIDKEDSGGDLRDAFDVYRRLAKTTFFAVDARLKSDCTALAKVGGPLRAILEDAGYG